MFYGYVRRLKKNGGVVFVLLKTKLNKNNGTPVDV
jgi:hypothetical protein